MSRSDPVGDFIKAACVPRRSSHSSGTLDEAEAIRKDHPEVAVANIHTASILGDEVNVRRFLQLDRANAASKGGPYGWDALTHLCFSRYLRLKPNQSQSFVGSAKALLDSGASANTGFFEQEHLPNPEFECVLYGAAGIAHNPELTRLLLERGANPNDGEVTYHTPETDDNRALSVLVGSGKLTPDSLAIMLLRKADWHDFEGLKFLLEHGGDPNHITPWGLTLLHQAVRRDNSASIVKALLDHRANPLLKARSTLGHQGEPVTALILAARRGRADLLDLFESHGTFAELQGVDSLIASCARNSLQSRTIAEQPPQILEELRAQGGTLLAEFAGNGNTDGVRNLLDLGVPVDARYVGDGYFGIAKESTALHVAAWRIRTETIQLLLARGAAVNATDGQGRTALQLAVRACVDSYWAERRTPKIVEALLVAGANTQGVPHPSGYKEVDELLKKHAE